MAGAGEASATSTPQPYRYARCLGQGNLGLPQDPARRIDPEKFVALAAIGKLRECLSNTSPRQARRSGCCGREALRESGTRVRCFSDAPKTTIRSSCPDEPNAARDDGRQTFPDTFGGLPIRKRLQNSQGNQVGRFHDRFDRSAAQIDFEELRPGNHHYRPRGAPGLVAHTRQTHRGATPYSWPSWHRQRETTARRVVDRAGNRRAR